MLIRCTQADHLNQQIIGFCIDDTCQKQRPYCHICLPLHKEHLHMLTSLELLQKWIQPTILGVLNIQKKIQECKLALDSLTNLFLPYFNFNIEQLPELGVSQIDQLIKGLCQTNFWQETLFKQLIHSIEQIKSIEGEILKKIKNQTNMKRNETAKVTDQLFVENLPSILKSNLKPLNFELLNQNSIRQTELCEAIAFNKDHSVIVAGCNNNIKVFQHIKGKLNQIQLLSEHTNHVNNLNFMKNTNNFISGSNDSLIIIWQEIGHNQWNYQQKLNGHSDQIFCLLLNNTDDLIISGSGDNKIQFWIKKDTWQQYQTITDHTDYVYSLSLNEQQNKLISCSYDQQILVIGQQKLDQKWIVNQRIKVDQCGFRLCFINDNQFTFQPYCTEQMHVYEMESNTKQYRKTKEIAVKFGSSHDYCLFPQQYVKLKCLLVNKNGQNINLMKKIENGDFINEQSIEFDTYNIFGKLSDDGEYLITWDKGTQEIQIRKCKKQ